MKFGLDLAPHHKVFGAFAIYSFTMGNIFPRFADLRHTMGVEEGAFGFGLIGAPVGTLISLTFAPPLLEKIGYRRAILWLIPILSLFYACASLAPNPFWFFALLVPVGLTLGCIEIILNLEADRTEHLVGRRIMTYYETATYFGPDRRNRTGGPERSTGSDHGGGQFRRIEIVRNPDTGIDVISDDLQVVV
jgi:MFS family permease